MEQSSSWGWVGRECGHALQKKKGERRHAKLKKSKAKKRDLCTTTSISKRIKVSLGGRVAMLVEKTE